MRKIPEAVVVDTTTGYTWTSNIGGHPFTVESATRFADNANAACKPEYRTHKVYRLMEVVTEWTTSAGVVEEPAGPRCTSCGALTGNVCWECA